MRFLKKPHELYNYEYLLDHGFNKDDIPGLPVPELMRYMREWVVPPTSHRKNNINILKADSTCRLKVLLAVPLIHAALEFVHSAFPIPICGQAQHPIRILIES